MIRDDYLSAKALENRGTPEGDIIADRPMTSIELDNLRDRIAADVVAECADVTGFRARQYRRKHRHWFDWQSEPADAMPPTPYRRLPHV